jgi:hypothetical protein
MEAPIQDFSRYVAHDYDLDGVSLQEGSRAIIFYGAANRDSRQFPLGLTSGATTRDVTWHSAPDRTHALA